MRRRRRSLSSGLLRGDAGLVRGGGSGADQRPAARSARRTLMLWSVGPVIAGSGRRGVEAGGSGTPGLRIIRKIRWSPLGSTPWPKMSPWSVM